jgi:hypothetical protein
MGKRRPEPVKQDRIRTITGSFGWIEHRFIRDGFLAELRPPEPLVYFFLAAVADAKGLSYYSKDTIGRLLSIPFEHTLEGAIAELEERELIAYENGIYQVLSLPDKPRGGA